MTSSLEVQVVSCQRNEFAGEDGKQVVFYKVFCVLPDGNIGYLTSRVPVDWGCIYPAVLDVKNGKLCLKLVLPDGSGVMVNDEPAPVSGKDKPGK